MDDIDRKLLNLIQEDFPIAAEPFRRWAETARHRRGRRSLERIGRLKEEGIIRRIGAVFDLRKLGFASTLCAARVPGREAAGNSSRAVNACPGVTHNYRRDARLQCLVHADRPRAKRRWTPPWRGSNGKRGSTTS